MKILVADDQLYNREILSGMLKDYGHEVVCVENGLEACEAMGESTDIELILMDVVMPLMDGLDATRRIKSKFSEKFIPIIFVTALDNDDVVSDCLSAGGDDYIPKPVSENVLISKVNAHRRSKLIYDNLIKANKELKYHRTMINREHAIVDHIFSQVDKRNATYCKNFEVYTSPMSMFNGDLALTISSPSGGVYGLVGDFTGHGLASAIGSLPVFEIFRQNVLNQASVSQIASQINQRLVDLLPASMFFCAAIFEIDFSGKLLTLWMGGMNDILFFSDKSDDIDRFSSKHLPLGILSSEAFDDSPDLIELKDYSRMYIFTDGVLEAENSRGEQFGQARIERVLSSNSTNAVPTLVKAVNTFVQTDTQNDDVSILEFSIGELVHCAKDTQEVVDIAGEYHRVRSIPWNLSIELRDEDLRSTSVVNQVMAFVSSIQGIEMHQDKIFTITSELYSNALEHGVLGLDSEMKNSADGFEEYYRLRQQRLENLDGHFIKIHFRYIKGEPNALELRIEDSGEGFDVSAITQFTSQMDISHGRGLNLLSSLCSNLTYSKDGREALAIYQFRSD